MLPAAAAAVAAVAAAGLAAFSNRHWCGWLPDDPPRTGRKQHGRPIPLAGIVLVPCTLPFCFAHGAHWLAVAIVLAGALGFADDRSKERHRDLDWRWKAVGLGLAAAAGATAVADPWADPLGWLAAAALVFVLTNATNFLDNTDGVACGLAATSLLSLSHGDGPLAAVGFAALGFLPWNWPRPSLFLGDAGAYALGVATGVAAAGQALVEPGALLAVAVQLGDFVQVVAARLVLGLPPWVGDRRHLTHIAQNLGLPRVATAPLFAGLQWLLALARS